jgi:hypothetical protein
MVFSKYFNDFADSADFTGWFEKISSHSADKNEATAVAQIVPVASQP